jgi:hypothetical protein
MPLLPSDSDALNQWTYLLYFSLIFSVFFWWRNLPMERGQKEQPINHNPLTKKVIPQPDILYLYLVIFYINA